MKQSVMSTSFVYIEEETVLHAIPIVSTAILPMERAIYVNLAIKIKVSTANFVQKIHIQQG